MAAAADVAPAQLEACLLQLMAPDTSIIQQAEATLKQYLKQVSSIGGLWTQINGSSHAQVRQMAAILLKKKINVHWSKLEESTQSGIKTQLLTQLCKEPERLVRSGLIQVAATLSKHQLPSGKWPELLGFINQCASSGQEAEREMAMTCFYYLTETVGAHLEPHFQEIKRMFLAALQDQQSLKVRTMAMKAACSLLNYLCDGDEVLQFQELIPPMIEVLKLCFANGEEVEAMEFLDAFGDLAEGTLPVLNPSIQSFVHCLLHAILNEDLEMSTRDSAALVVQKLLETKPKSIGKKGLVPDIINVTVQIMSKDDSSAGGIMSGHFTEEEDQEEDDEPTPTKMSQRILDVMALNVPAKYLDETILKVAAECLQSPQVAMRKAGTIALGVIAEGIADRLRDRIDQILPFLYQAAKDSDSNLREAACFALGQWAEHLQPEILDHYESLLPVIFTLLDDATPSVKGTSCYVLESLTENMDSEAVLPYLEALMTKLVQLVQTSKPRVQLMAISAIGSTAVGAETAFQPYFMATATMLTPFLQITDEKYLSLRGRALECMGYMAIAVDKEVYTPTFKASMECAIQSLQVQDPELSDFCFAFFCNVSKVFGEDFAPYLNQVIPLIAAAINMDDGMTIKVSGSAASQQPQLASFNDSDDEGDDEDSKNTIVSVRTSMLDMKAGAVSAIQSLADHTGALFDPYIPSCMQVLSAMTTYFHDSVRSAAVSALCQMVLVSADARPATTEWVKGNPNAVAVDPLTSKVLEAVMVVCMESLEDDEPTVVEHALDGIVKMADRIGPIVTAPQMNALLECILSILKEEHPSQGTPEDDDEYDEDEPVSLLESTCELISCLCRGYGDVLDQQMKVIIPVLSKYMKGVRPSKDRATVFGCIAEVCQEMGPCTVSYATDLVPVVLSGLNDEESNVRQNCAFCLGIFAEVGGAALQPHYASLLQGLRPLFDDAHNGVADNAAAAVARMMMANPAGVPMAQVLPVFLQKLPLTEDVTESDTVFKCLLSLIQNQNQELISNHLHRVVELFAGVLEGSIDIDEDLHQHVVNCLRWLAESQDAALTQAVSSLSTDQQGALKRHLG